MVLYKVEKKKSMLKYKIKATILKLQVNFKMM